MPVNGDFLAVYGVIAALASLFHAMYCGVGQAIQPLVSANTGAKEYRRVNCFWKYALKTAFILAVLRSVLISGILSFVLPFVWGINGVWYVMPISEAIISIVAFVITRSAYGV